MLRQKHKDTIGHQLMAAQMNSHQQYTNLM